MLTRTFTSHSISGKKIIFRCEDHLDCDVDEIEKLALVEKRYQDLDENDLVDGETFFKQLDSE